jgi:hypothetical protein
MRLGSFSKQRYSAGLDNAAMIYQHEARGADRAITDAIDTHVQAEQRNDDDDDDGSAGALAPVG